MTSGSRNASKILIVSMSPNTVCCKCDHLQDSSAAPALSSCYRATWCSGGHTCSPPTALLEGKNPAQEGRVEGLHEGPDEGLPPSSLPLALEGLQWFLWAPGPAESCQRVACVLALLVAVFILNSFLTATAQNNNRWTIGYNFTETMCLLQAPPALLYSGSEAPAPCAWMKARPENT